MELLVLSPWSIAVVIFLLVLLGVLLGVCYDKREQNKPWRQDDEVSSEQMFRNLPNFRQAGGCGLVTEDGRKVRDGLLYRSSRTDFLTASERERFKELGIKSIIDLRRISEYRKADGAKLLDDLYSVCVLKKGKVDDYRSRKSAKSADSYIGRRYLVNMVSMDMVKHVVNQANFLVRYTSLLLLPVDWLFSVHLFVRFYNWLVVNRYEMYEQYVGVLEFNKPAVADILRLLLEGTPALIHCAHGKDRTGVVVAVILSCLGVGDEGIAQDYGQSEAGLACMRRRLYRETIGRYGFKEEFAGAKPETMRQVLKEIKKRYGSVCSYLESAGFGANEQEQLRGVFLE